jgi:hypothetical protein
MPITSKDRVFLYLCPPINDYFEVNGDDKFGCINDVFFLVKIKKFSPRAARALYVPRSSLRSVYLTF